MEARDQHGRLIQIISGPREVHLLITRDPLVTHAKFTDDNATSTRGPPVENEWMPSDEAVLVGYRVGLMSLMLS
jgi:hypothetical protein